MGGMTKNLSRLAAREPGGQGGLIGLPGCYLLQPGN